MRDNDDVKALAQADVARALAEDVGTGDLTAGLIDPARRARARILAREAAVICGAPWAEAALRALDPTVQITWHVAEGQRCDPNQVVLEMEGNARALLSAERTALNFLQLLSAVATKTGTYVDVVAGTRAQIVDTRKTIPGLRLAQQYAVRVGGGTNHRIGLHDAVLIKENHIAAAGGVTAVLRAAQQVASQAQLSRSKSKPWSNWPRRWMQVPGWCCWTTCPCPCCARPCASMRAGRFWKSRAASRSKACARWPRRAWTASPSAR